MAGDSCGLTFVGLPRLRGTGLIAFSAFDPPPPSGVLGLSSRAWATFRGRPLGRFGCSCVGTSPACVTLSSWSEVGGCLPFPLAGARFLGTGRVRSGGSDCSSPSSLGCLEDRPPATLAVAFAFPFLIVSYRALHWTTSVNIQSCETQSHQLLTALSFLPFPIFSLTAFHLPSPSS